MLHIAYAYAKSVVPDVSVPEDITNIQLTDTNNTQTLEKLFEYYKTYSPV